MYTLNKYNFKDGLCQTLMIDKCSEEVKDWFLDYITNYCLVNTNQTSEFTYKYNSNFTICTVSEKRMTINKGYLFDTVSYETKRFESYSISYYSKFNVFNIRMITGYQDGKDMQIIRNYDQVIRQLKDTLTFRALE